MQQLLLLATHLDSSSTTSLKWGSTCFLAFRTKQSLFFLWRSIGVLHVQLYRLTHTPCTAFAECQRCLQAKTAWWNVVRAGIGTIMTPVSKFLLLLWANQLSGTVCSVYMYRLVLKYLPRCNCLLFKTMNTPLIISLLYIYVPTYDYCISARVGSIIIVPPIFKMCMWMTLEQIDVYGSLPLTCLHTFWCFPWSILVISKYFFWARSIVTSLSTGWGESGGLFSDQPYTLTRLELHGSWKSSCLCIHVDYIYGVERTLVALH